MQWYRQAFRASQGDEYDDKEDFTKACVIIIEKKAKADVTEYDMIEYKEAIWECNDRCNIYQDNKIKCYALIWITCNKVLQTDRPTDNLFFFICTYND